MKHPLSWRSNSRRVPMSICILSVFATLASTTWSHQVPKEIEASHLDALDALDLNSTSLIPHVRVRRSHGSCTTGMSVGQNENAGTSTTLNNAANSGGRGRAKRSPDSPAKRLPILRYTSRIVRKYANIVGRLVGHRFLTRTQELFFWINLDVAGALRRFLRSRPLFDNPDVRSRVVVDPLGITCDTLCAPSGALFGLVGFCSRDYCRCTRGHSELAFEEHGHGEHEHFGDRNFNGVNLDVEERYRCPRFTVFDPLTLRCTDPRLTPLCQDNVSFKNRGIRFGGRGWGPSSKRVPW